MKPLSLEEGCEVRRIAQGEVSAKNAAQFGAWWAESSVTRLEVNYSAKIDLDIILRTGIERGADVIGLGA